MISKRSAVRKFYFNEKTFTTTLQLLKEHLKLSRNMLVSQGDL